MKFVNFCYKGTKEVGIITDDGGAIGVSSCVSELNGTDMVGVMRYIDKHPEIMDVFEKVETMGGGVDLSNVQLLAPIEHPIHDVICVGVNYQSHIRETQKGLDPTFKRPEKAIYFGKRAIRIIGQGETIKARLDVDPCLDYEAELAVIIGKTGDQIREDEAQDYVFGYSVFNDISSRTVQSDHKQWFLGKSLDTYTAMGPYIVTRNEFSYPPALEIKSYVNGELRQHGTTGDFIHGISEMIVELSSCMTLECGDIIATGTPSGVGMGFDPPRYMSYGDEVICEIEKIGSLRNICGR